MTLLIGGEFALGGMNVLGGKFVLAAWH